MATKKQQRRREKERRHEYEEVWVDAEGNELEDFEPPEAQKAKPAKAAAKGQPPKSRSGRPMREVKPPSWSRVARRSVLFAPLLYVALSLGKHPPAIGVRLALSIGYTAIFVPTFYWIDRLTYRRYLRASGKAPDEKPKS
jgi:hypothetical protein